MPSLFQADSARATTTLGLFQADSARATTTLGLFQADSARATTTLGLFQADSAGATKTLGLFQVDNARATKTLRHTSCLPYFSHLFAFANFTIVACEVFTSWNTCILRSFVNYIQLKIIA